MMKDSLCLTNICVIIETGGGMKKAAAAAATHHYWPWPNGKTTCRNFLKAGERMTTFFPLGRYVEALVQK